MKEYIFFLYNATHLSWQFCLTCEKPQDEVDRILKRHNSGNDFLEGYMAESVNYCTLEDWIKSLRLRGEYYE